MCCHTAYVGIKKRGGKAFALPTPRFTPSPKGDDLSDSAFQRAYMYIVYQLDMHEATVLRNLIIGHLRPRKMKGLRLRRQYALHNAGGFRLNGLLTPYSR
jgi:hypothetical protein